VGGFFVTEALLFAELEYALVGNGERLYGLLDEAVIVSVGGVGFDVVLGFGFEVGVGFVSEGLAGFTLDVLKGEVARHGEEVRLEIVDVGELGASGPDGGEDLLDQVLGERGVLEVFVADGGYSIIVFIVDPPERPVIVCR